MVKLYKEHMRSLNIEIYASIFPRIYFIQLIGVNVMLNVKIYPQYKIKILFSQKYFISMKFRKIYLVIN